MGTHVGNGEQSSTFRSNDAKPEIGPEAQWDPDLSDLGEPIRNQRDLISERAGAPENK